ncbi:MAG: PAS domain S-box protein [Steroidobacteraceae bacterium]
MHTVPHQPDSVHGGAVAGLRARDWQLRYATAVEASGHLLFEWDLASGRIHYPFADESGVFGHPVAAVDSLANWVEHIHPQDRERFLARLEESFAHLEPTTHVLEYRFRRADGQYVWIEARGRLVFDNGEAMGRGVGLLADISARKQVESRLGLSGLILQGIREAVAVVDAAGRIAWANLAFDTLAGCARGASIGRDWADACAAADPASGLLQARLIERAALLGHETASMRARGADGDLRELELSVTCVVGEHAPLWIVLHRDVSERVSVEERMLEHNLGEQSRLGVALHEGLGQDLAGASLLLGAARADLRNGSDADETLASVEALLQSAVGRCADLAQRLSPFLLDRSGLANALGDLVRRSGARAGRGIEFQSTGAVDTVADAGTAYHVFRVAESALELALQLIPTGALRLLLQQDPDEGLLLRIEAAAAAPAGLASLTRDPRSAMIRRRAETLGGRFEWCSPRGELTCGELNVPLRTRAVAPRVAVG